MEKDSNSSSQTPSDHQIGMSDSKQQHADTIQHHENVGSDQINEKHHRGHHHHHDYHTPGVDPENRAAAKGDDSDGKITWTWKQILATISLSGLYVGSQIPLYFVGGSLSFIAADIGGVEASAWLSVAYALAFSAMTPLCGYLQDLIGRRYITLLGGLVLMMGVIVLATAQHFRDGIVGMAFAGIGAAIGELTALAGTSELVPVNKRGFYLALVTGFVLPFTPYLMYAQLLSTYHTWRYGIWICLIWNGIWWIFILILYFPQSQTRAKGQQAIAILKQIDYLGGALSIMGLTLFLVAMQAGGYSHSWSSAYVLCTMLIGIALIVAFVVWEWRFCSSPMVPHEMFAGQRIVAMAYGIAFVAGMNFYAMLNFFPTLFHDVFSSDPVQVGLKGLAPGLSTTFGAVFFNAALTWFKGKNRELLLIATVIMTAFGGSLAAVTPETPGLAVALGTMTGLGVGGVLVPAATVAVTVTPDTTIATCVALSLTVRAVGGSIGYAIYYNVFINKLTPKLPLLVAQYAIAAGLDPATAEAFVTTYLTAPAELASLPGVTPAILHGAEIGKRWAYARALKWVWITTIPFGVLSILACCFIGNITKYMTNRIAANLKQ